MAPYNIKRKKAKNIGNQNKKLKLDQITTNEDITSEESDVSGEEVEEDIESEDEETPQQKLVRLGKQHLEELKKEEQERQEKKDIDRAPIAHRLKEEALEQFGRLQREVAINYLPVDQNAIVYKKKHSLPLTSLVVSSDGKYIFTASKDCLIIKWCAQTFNKIKQVYGEKPIIKKNNKKKYPSILALAISSDSKLLASAGLNKVINIWNPENLELIRILKTNFDHRKAVNGLVFRKNSHELFSCSDDKTIRLWNLDEMAYMDMGEEHYDSVLAIDCLHKELPVTCGADAKVVLWKLQTGTKLIFLGSTYPIDCVRMINDDNFVSGSQDGTLAIWTVTKKKPIAAVSKAHGVDPASQMPRWISSVASLPHTDLIASGSCDGSIKMWRYIASERKISHLFDIFVDGFINDLRFYPSGKSLAAAVGKEHKLGRWWTLPVKNTLVVIPLRIKEMEPSKLIATQANGALN